MPEKRPDAAAELTTSAQQGCPKCQLLKATALALTAAEYGLPALLQGLPPPARDAIPTVAQLYTIALDSARRGQCGPAAAALLQATQALTRAMAKEPIEPGNPAWTALAALHSTVLAFTALEGDQPDIKTSLDASTAFLATDTELAERAAKFINISDPHQEPTTN